jgi:hypothetical protein
VHDPDVLIDQQEVPAGSVEDPVVQLERDPARLGEVVQDPVERVPGNVA